MISRRRFLRTTAAGIALPFWQARPDSSTYYIGVIADTHAGTEFGPNHLVIASTRYDADAYLILEIDAKAGTHRPLNLDLVEWNTHFSRPYVGQSIAF